VGKAPGQSVFPLHHETAKMIRRDLEAAGIPYETEAGFADFHSLRGTYISALVRSGASIKTVQTLARHSNPALTLARYAKTDLHDVIGAVEFLPGLSRPPPDPEAWPMVTTVIDGGHISTHLAHLLPTAGDGAGRELADTGGAAGTKLATTAETDRTQVSEDVGLGHALAVPDGPITERAGFEPARHLSAPNGLANRRFRPLSHLSDSNVRRVASPMVSKPTRPGPRPSRRAEGRRGETWH